VSDVVADTSISVWKASTGTLMITLTGHRAGCLCVKLHTLKGNTLDSTLCVPYGAKKAGAAQSVAPVRLLLISGGADHAVLLWDVRAGSCLQKLVSHSEPVTAILVSGCSVLSLAGARYFTQVPNRVCCPNYVCCAEVL
jgi:WD40 repeat protein